MVLSRCGFLQSRFYFGPSDAILNSGFCNYSGKSCILECTVMKRLFLAFAWMFLSTGAILTSIAATQTWRGWRYPAFEGEAAESGTTLAINSTTASKNGAVKGVESVIEAEDARPHILANFLERHNSPLQPADHYGEFLVHLADKYGLDFRLLPAMAMQESNLCKKIPENTYNCLGFGIHAKGTLAFESYEANFERAAREIKERYVDQGRVTPELIMKKYTPSSDGSWADSVNQWMAEMRFDDRKLGRELKTEANVLEFATPNTGD